MIFLVKGLRIMRDKTARPSFSTSEDAGRLPRARALHRRTFQLDAHKRRNDYCDRVETINDEWIEN